MPEQDLKKIKFGRLVSMTGEDLHRGELIVENGIIKEFTAGPVEPFEGQVVDLSDHLILPGFVNAHCHLALSALHQKVPALDRFQDWALSLIPQNRQLTLDERRASISPAADELLDSGVTTLADYLAEPELLPDYAALPFRKQVYLEVLGFPGTLAPHLLKDAESVLKNPPAQDFLLTLGLAPHAPYSVSPALFQGLRDLADEYSCPFSCHVAELAEEIEFLREDKGDLVDLLKKLESYDDDWQPPGTGALHYLDDLGALDSMLAVHLNYIEDEMDLLVSTCVTAAFCPRSTRWFKRTRWMPVRQLLNRSVAVGIGTDSLASNDSLNFLKELRAAEEMLPDVSREEILQMATHLGAEALGLRTGTIAPAMPADLIGFRAKDLTDSWFDIPFEVNRDKVDFVMIQGGIVRGAPPS